MNCVERKPSIVQSVTLVMGHSLMTPYLGGKIKTIPWKAVKAEMHSMFSHSLGAYIFPF